VAYGTIDSIKSELKAGRPVSVSVKYSELSNYRFDKNWSAGHQIVVTGFFRVEGHMDLP